MKRLKKFFEKLIDNHEWIPIVISLISMLFSWVVLLITIGFRLAM